jgi:hypothetical protein
MAKVPEYPDKLSHRVRSVLPVKVQDTIIELKLALDKGADVSSLISEFREGTNSMPAAAVPQACSELQYLGRLNIAIYGEAKIIRIAEWLKLKSGPPPLAPRELALRVLNVYPALGHLLQFYGDGYVREASLRGLAVPPESPFEFTAIVYRLNDWVSQVRDAATTYAQSSFPSTDPQLIAFAALFLLPRIDNFSRWKSKQKQLVFETFLRSDVLNELESILLNELSEGLGRPFNRMLRWPHLDKALPRLAKEARQPAVRAIAIDALLNKRARSFDGYKTEWVDKTYGRSRRVPAFSVRKFEHNESIGDLFTLGTGDKASIVRKVTAMALNERDMEQSQQRNEAAAKLAEDKSAAVRIHAAHYLKQLEHHPRA